MNQTTDSYSRVCFPSKGIAHAVLLELFCESESDMAGSLIAQQAWSGFGRAFSRAGRQNVQRSDRDVTGGHSPVHLAGYQRLDW
jgi:hypothetical protein